MSAIQVKDVPEDLHEALRQRAAAEGMDLQAYVLQVLRRDLALPSQQEWLDGLRRRPETVGLPPADEILRAEREQRERELDDVCRH